MTDERDEYLKTMTTEIADLLKEATKMAFLHSALTGEETVTGLRLDHESKEVTIVSGTIDDGTEERMNVPMAYTRVDGPGDVPRLEFVSNPFDHLNPQGAP